MGGAARLIIQAISRRSPGAKVAAKAAKPANLLIFRHQHPVIGPFMLCLKPIINRPPPKSHKPVA